MLRASYYTWMHAYALVWYHALHTRIEALTLTHVGMRIVLVRAWLQRFAA
jgi:hypothetical protein